MHRLIFLTAWIVFYACGYFEPALDPREMGDRAAKDGNFEKAIKHYTSAIDSKKLPVKDLVGVYNARGKAYAELQRFDHARAEFDAAIKLDPSDATAYFLRGLIAPGDQDARQDFDQALNRNPKYEEALFYRAHIFDRAGDIDRAIDDYSKVVQLNPKHADAYAGRGRLYHIKAAYDKAIADYDKAIQNDSKNDFTLTLRGGSYYEKQMLDRAIEDFASALRINPRNSLALTSRGMAKAANRDYVSAIADFDGALATKPDDEDTALTLLERGRAYRRLRELENALEDFTDAIKLSPDLSEAFRLRGVTLREMGQHKRALSDLDAAIKKDQKSAPNFYSRGLEHFYLGYFDQSAKDFTQALDLDRDHGFAAIWLYLAQAHLGQKQALMLDVRLQRMDVRPWLRKIGSLYAGKLSAEEFLEAAKDSDSKKNREQQCEAYFYLGQNALLKGSRVDAIKYFKLTLETGITDFVEYHGAKTALARLQDPKNNKEKKSR